MDWYNIWHWIIDNWDNLLGLLAISARGMPFWPIVAIAGLLVAEGIRHFVRMVKLGRHVRHFEQAENESRIGVIEKPSWERKRNKEVKISDRIYHPLQRDPGGIWLQIASNKDDVQSQAILVGDLPKLIHDSVEFHSHQHRNEVKVEASLGVLFVALGAFVIIAYFILNQGWY